MQFQGLDTLTSGNMTQYIQPRPRRVSRYAKIPYFDKSTLMLSRNNTYPPPTKPKSFSETQYTDKEKCRLSLESLLRTIVSTDSNNNCTFETETSTAFTDVQLRKPKQENKERKRVQRRVSFADSVGQKLTSVRIVTEGRDTPPILTNCFNHLLTKEEVKPKLLPSFAQPLANFSLFSRRLAENSVALESLDVKVDAITGQIKVKNLGFEKNVVIRYTTDEWETYNDVSCSYTPPAYNLGRASFHDKFSFHIDADPSWKSFEFCIRYNCQGQEFWDNNNTNNYRLAVRAD